MEMTGTTNPDRRAELWEMPDKRLFFMTPGTLKNDLAKGTRPGSAMHQQMLTHDISTCNAV